AHWRMSRSKSDAVVFDSVAEKNVTGLFNIRHMNDRTFGRRFHPLEGPGQPFRIPGELYRGGVGKKLALTRDGRFDHAAEKSSVPADERNEKADHKNDHVAKKTDAGPDFGCAADVPVALAIGPAHHPIAQQRDAKQPVHK